MGPLDFLVVAVYFGVIGFVGLRVARRQRTSDEYFIARRAMPAWAIAFTLMATLIGTGTVVGHPATVYQKGLILLLGTLTLPLVLLFVAWFIVPFYRNRVRMSAYEFIGARFGSTGRFYASAAFLADRIFDVGVTLLTTAIPVQLITGWDLTTTIIAVGAFTVIYTALGGVEAVVWTDVIQGIILIGGAVFIFARLAFAPECGSPFAVFSRAWEDGRFAMGSFDLSWASLFDATHTTQWLLILAALVNWTRRFCADQHMVQRYLIARSDREASIGAFVNAMLCVPVYVTFMLIGAGLYGYYAIVGGGPELADQVVPHFVTTVLPSGIVGLVLAAMLAASMSSVSADLNSMATVITADYLVPLKPTTSDRGKLLFGKLMVLVSGTAAAVAGVALIPGQHSAPIMERVVVIAAILSGGTLGLFFLGFFTRRATGFGALVGIAACLVFTAWGVLTQPAGRIIDIGYNFPLNPVLIGVLGNLIVFVVGYLVSLLLPTPPAAVSTASPLASELRR